MKILSEFQLPKNATKSGGKSPSQRMQIDGTNYQVKRSNSTKWMRRWFGYDPDPSDLMGEYIASKIAQHLSPSIYGVNNSAAELSPEVELVLDPTLKELKLASKYLNDNKKTQEGNHIFLGGTLDEVWRGSFSPEEAQKNIEGHAIISSGKSLLASDDKTKVLGLDQEIKTKLNGQEVTLQVNKKQVYQALKLSLMLGDHDVNPGNMYIVYNTQTKKANVCRIDYGHAFCDLIKKWGRGIGRDHSPNLGEGRGVVLDALNRTKINGAKSKLVRDYRGIIPDHAFADVLRESVDKGAMENAKNDCKIGFEKFFGYQGKGLTRLKNKISSCFSTLSSRMGFGTSPSGNTIDTVLRNATNFVNTNIAEMKSVANLIDIQGYVQQIEKGTIDPENAMSVIKDLYSKDEKYLKGKKFSDKVEWVREDDGAETVKCSLEELINTKLSKLRVKDNAHDRLSSFLGKLQNDKSLPKMQDIQQQDSKSKIAVVVNAEAIRKSLVTQPKVPDNEVNNLSIKNKAQNQSVGLE